MVSLPYIAPQWQTSPTSKKAVALGKQIKDLNNKLNAFDGPVARMKKYDKGTPEYTQALADFNTLNTNIIKLQKQEAELNIPAIQSRLDKARDVGDSAQIIALQEQLDGLNAVVNSSTSSSASSDPKISGPQFVEGDDLGNAIRQAGLTVDTDPDTGKSVIRSDSQSWAQAGQEHLVWVGSSKGFQSQLPGFSGTKRTADISASYNELEKKILQDAQKQPGGLQSLFDRMYKAGLISKETYNSKSTTNNDFTSNLLYALREFSKKTIRDYELNGIKDPMSFDEYLDKEFTPEGPRVSYDSVTTTRDTAASDLDRFFMQYLGNGATKEQHDQYYKQLRAAEKKAIRTTTTSGTSQNVSGEFIDELDKTEMMRKVAGKALEGTNIDTVLKAGAGAAQAVNGVLAYARSYGVNLSNKDALNYVANELKLGQGDTKKINAKILAISKSTYSNLSDSLSEDVSLKELSTNFIFNMAKTLELNSDSIDALDPTIQTALKNNGNKGTMNLTDFDRMLRNDPRWAKTKNAREEASSYALEVLKDFGLMA
jgi:hypothetical protein